MNGLYRKTSSLRLEIQIKRNRGYLTGDYPEEYVRNLTSYTVPGAVFTKLYKRGHWDGRKHLYSKVDKSIPAGLVPLVSNSLKQRGYTVSVIDYREENIPAVGNKGITVGGKLRGKFGQGIYDYQYKAAEALINGKRGILKIATNGGKTSIAAAVIHHLAVPTVFVVPGRELFYQSRETLADLLEISEDSIGMVGDGLFSIGDWVTVASMETLHSKIQNQELSEEDLNRWQCLFADEVHMGGSDTFYEVLDQIPAYWRGGLSATPYDRSDSGTLRLIAQTGPMLYEVTTKELVEKGISIQPFVKLLKIEEPKLPSGLKKWQKVQQLGIVENQKLNQLIATEAVDYIKEGKHCVIMVDKLDQGWAILDKVKKHVDNVDFIHGSLGSEKRQKLLQDFKEDRILGLVSTSVLNQGVDMDCIDVLILAGGGKAVIPTIQRVGRGLRRGRGRDKLVVVDVMNFTHPYLIKHSQRRLNIYKREQCYKIHTVDEAPSEI